MARRVDAEEYERLVREAADSGGQPPDVEPPESYEMSAPFRAWLVERMRRHVMEGVSAAGLDRMAVVGFGSREQDPSQEEE